MNDDDLETRLARLAEPDDLENRLRSLRAKDPEYHKSLLKKNRQAQGKERIDRTASYDDSKPVDAYLGSQLGLAEAGLAAMRGAMNLRINLPGDADDLATQENLRNVSDLAENAKGYWNPTGDKGNIGRMAGRAVGEVGLMVAGGAGTVGALGRLAPKYDIAAKAARAIKTARAGSVDAKTAAEVALTLPSDIVLGAGNNENSQDLARETAVRTLLGIGGAGVGNVLGAGIGAARAGIKTHTATDVGEGLMDGASEAALRAGAEQMPTSGFQHKVGESQLGPSIPLPKPDYGYQQGPGIPMPRALGEPVAGQSVLGPALPSPRRGVDRQLTAGDEGVNLALARIYAADPIAAKSMSAEQQQALRATVQGRVRSNQPVDDLIPGSDAAEREFVPTGPASVARYTPSVDEQLGRIPQAAGGIVEGVRARQAVPETPAVPESAVIPTAVVPKAETFYNPEGRRVIITPSVRVPGQFQASFFHDAQGTRPFQHFTESSAEKLKARIADAGYDLPNMPVTPRDQAAFDLAQDRLGTLQSVRDHGDEWTPADQAEWVAVHQEMKDLLGVPRETPAVPDDLEQRLATLAEPQAPSQTAETDDFLPDWDVQDVAGRKTDWDKLAPAQLVELLNAEQAVVDREGITAGSGFWTRQDTNGGPGWSGQSLSSGMANKRMGYALKRIDAIETRLKALGMTDESLADLRGDASAAIERAAIMDPRPVSPKIDDGLDDGLNDVRGAVPFANPIGPALKFAAKNQALGGATIGAGIGAVSNEDSPGKGAFAGAIIGGSLGSVGSHFAASAASNAGLRSRMVQAAYDAAEDGIDFTGSIRKAMEAQYLKSGGATKISNIFASRAWNLTDAFGHSTGVIDRLGRAVESTLAPMRNPSHALAVVNSTQQTLDRFYEEGIHGFVDRGTKIAPAYREIFEDLGDDVQRIRDFWKFVKASRDVGRVATMGLDAVGGDAAAHARNQVLAADADPAFLAGRAKLESYIDGIGQYAVESGYWTPEMFAALKASDAMFTPYSRVRLAGFIKGTGLGTSALGKSTGVKKFVGSDHAVDNLATTLAEYTQRIVKAADKYHAHSTMITAVEELGPLGQAILSPLPFSSNAGRNLSAASGEAWRQLGLPSDASAVMAELHNVRVSPDNPIITRWGANGVKEQYMIHHEGLLRALEAIDGQYLPDWLRLAITPLKMAKHVFTAATTGLSPVFAFGTNLTRDVVTGAARTEVGLSPKSFARGYAEGIKSAWGGSDIINEARAYGGGGTSLVSHDASPGAVQRAYSPTSKMDRFRAAAAHAGDPIKLLERSANASDAARRAGEYIGSLQKNMHRVDSGEWTIHDLRLNAARDYRNVTVDFGNKSGAPLLRFFSEFVPFFGVSTNAPVGLAESAARNPKRLAGTAIAVASAAGFSWAMSQKLNPEEHAEYMDRSRTEQTGSIMVPLPNGGIIKFAVPAEFGVVHSSVTAALRQLRQEDPHAGDLVVESLLRALPPGISGWLQGRPSVPIPVIQQMVEIGNNRTDFGGRPIIPRRLSENRPEDQKLDTTSPTAVAVADAGRSLGYESFAPLQAAHMIRGVSSSATPLLETVTDPIANAYLKARGKAPVLDSERIPMPFFRKQANPLRAFYVPEGTPPGGTQSESDFYAIREQVHQANRDLQKAVKGEVTVESLREHMVYMNPQAKQIVSETDNAMGTYRNVQQAIQQKFEAGAITGEQARLYADRLTRLRQQKLRSATLELRRLNATP